MRFLIVNTDYGEFLSRMYAQHPGLAEAPYDRQVQVRADTLFGTSDFYPRRLNELGQPTVEVHANNRIMQLAWAKEQGLKVDAGAGWELRLRRGVLPWIGRAAENGWMFDILEAQIRAHRPDVVLNHGLEKIPAAFWRKVRGRNPGIRLLVGQVASPLSERTDLSVYDLMLSSLPNYVEGFRTAGLRAELFRLGFDPRVLELLGRNCHPSAQSSERLEEISADGSHGRATGQSLVGSAHGAHGDIPLACAEVSFVGSLSPDHAARIAWLERLCRELPVKVWGRGFDFLPADSAIRKAYQGEAWGIDMYRLLAGSRITLNHHIGIAGDFANNMRLYEATGVGTMLVTDAKRNLAEMFDPGPLGREVVAYRDAEDCVRQVRHYLDHEPERRAIAAAGQARALRDHTYAQRMAELVAIVKRYLQ